MVSNFVVYQLALIALVWLFLMLSWLWPSEPAAARPLPPTPVTPPRKRSTAPKPFTGLTRKPHCDACEQTIKDRRLPLPSAPPPKIISTRGRRHHVDTYNLPIHRAGTRRRPQNVKQGGLPLCAPDLDAYQHGLKIKCVLIR